MAFVKLTSAKTIKKKVSAICKEERQNESWCPEPLSVHTSKATLTHSPKCLLGNKNPGRSHTGSSFLREQLFVLEQVVIDRAMGLREGRKVAQGHSEN